MTTFNPAEYLVDARALTLKNPWAHLIAHHEKRVENRSWMPWESVDRLLIHAGKGWDRESLYWINGRWGIEPVGVVESAVVAVADLAFACDSARRSESLVVRCPCGPWAFPGQCHWNLTNILTLPEPVPCAGRQGLWRPAPEVVAAVADQLAQLNEEKTDELPTSL